MNDNFEQIIILGSGSFAGKCIQYLVPFNIPIKIYESNINKISSLSNIAKSNSIEYMNLEKNQIFEELTRIKKRTIIFVISCAYIIPKEVISNSNLSIINYHNALLPNHPGRNAEAWAIFNQDEKIGITWHLVDEGIDTGDIIIQREIEINESHTSISILKLQNKMAFEAFIVIINKMLKGEINHFKQKDDLNYKMHLSKDIPNNGFLDISWDIDKISAFLRAMDYGALRTMGQAKTIFEGNIYKWKKYLILDLESESDNLIHNKEDNYIEIVRNNKAVRLIDIYISGGA